MNRWQAIIFDLDDTLYPEHDYVLSGFRAVATWGEAHLGLNATLSFEQLAGFLRAGIRGDTFNRWLRQIGLGDANGDEEQLQSLVTHLVQVYRMHVPTLQPFPEVTQCLPSLSQHFRLGLVSDGYLDVQQGKLAALALAPYLAAVVFSDQWGRAAWKPSIIPFQVVLEKLDVNAVNAVYVADNPLKDFYGPRQLGMATIWLKHAQGDYTKQKPPSLAHEPDLSLATWAEFNSFIMD